MVKNVIRLSDSTLQKLKEQGEPFESVDECLARILNKPCKTSPPQTPSEEDALEPEGDE